MSAGSMQIENDWCLIADVKSSKGKAATALFNMNVTFVEAEWHFKVICESGNTWRMVRVKLSWNANGMFWGANKTAIFNSVNTTFWYH